MIRENSIYINFLVVAAIATIAFAQQPPKLFALLAIPLSATCIYWVYLSNDIMITALRKFFTDEFPRRVLAALGKSDDELFKRDLLQIIGSWEIYHRSPASRRRERKIMTTVLVLLSFLGTSLGALLLTLEPVLGVKSWYLFFWSVDVLLVLIVAGVIVGTADW